MSAARVRALVALVGCALPLVAGDPGPSAAEPQAPDPAGRCAALIGVFDEIVVNRFDYQILMLEDYELAAARRARRQAETECAAGRYDFGLDLIKSALHEIGVVADPDEDDPPDPHRWPDGAGLRP